MDGDNFNDQLASLHAISVEIAGIRSLAEVHDRALDHCLRLTQSEFGFTGVLNDGGSSGSEEHAPPGSEIMTVVAVKGFAADPQFYENFHLMALRRSTVGVVIQENRPHLTNDIAGDPFHVGQPPGHPPVARFLGVPLRVKNGVIGMIGVANKPGGYQRADERLLSIFAGQVAVAVENARLYEDQRQMISELRQLHERLTEVERNNLVRRERDRIAGVLHDSIEQDVFAIGVGLTSLLEDRSVEERMARQLRDLRELSIRASDSVRRALFAFTENEDNRAALADDIRSMLARLEQETGLRAHLTVSGREPEDFRVAEDVARIVVREALRNVAKHAEASMVLLSLRYSDHALDLVIQDDGVGMPEALIVSFPESYMHFGLRHIREMVVSGGGSFVIDNGEEAGVVIRVALPFGRGSRP